MLVNHDVEMSLNVDVLAGNLFHKVAKHTQKERDFLGPPSPSSSPSTPSSLSFITPNSLPWDYWEFNKAFFRNLARWTLDHPDLTLDCLVYEVACVIDNGEDFSGQIPDEPFVARSLIAALTNLMKLGVVGHCAIIQFAVSLMKSLDRPKG